MYRAIPFAGMLRASDMSKIKDISVSRDTEKQGIVAFAQRKHMFTSSTQSRSFSCVGANYHEKLRIETCCTPATIVSNLPLEADLELNLGAGPSPVLVKLFREVPFAR